MANTEWSKPYCGVTHKIASRDRWVTVTDRGSFADLTCWYPGCGFHPIASMHDSAEQAKAAGEQWLSTTP